MDHDQSPQAWRQQITSRVPDFSQRQLTAKQVAQNSRFSVGGCEMEGLRLARRTDRLKWQMTIREA